MLTPRYRRDGTPRYSCRSTHHSRTSWRRCRREFAPSPYHFFAPTDYIKDSSTTDYPWNTSSKMYAEEPFHLYTVDEYIQLIAQYISLLRSDLVLERFVSQSPAELLIAPHWGLKNYEFTQQLQNYLRNIRMK